MAGQILVPLKKHDRIEEIIPYIEEVVKPGMRAVFLLRYPVESGICLRDYWITTESTREAMLAGRKIMERHSWEVQRGLAERKVSLAGKALQKMGVEVTVEVYTGGLGRVLEDFAASGDVRLIIMTAGIGFRIMKYLNRTIRFFSSFKQSAVPPVLLLHPGQGV